MPTNAAMIAANEKLFATAKIRPEWQAEIDKAAKRLVKSENKARFQAVEARLGVPWYIVAVTKEREAGIDAQFSRNIAQGDPWKERSTHVPAGRGPFSNWDDAADDALLKCAPFMGLWRNWTIGGSLTILLKYNGIGYYLRGLPSPYLFAATTAYVKGKFVRDGVFDPNFVDQQIGCAALLLAMQKLDSSIVFSNDNVEPRPTASPPKEIINEATKPARQVRTAAGAAGAAAGGNEAAKTTTGTQAPSSAPLLPPVAAYSLIGIAVAVVIVASIVIARRKAAIVGIW